MTITLSTGRKLNVFSKNELWRVNGYDHALACCQTGNCGYYFTDYEVGDVIDDEYDLAEAYEIMNNFKSDFHAGMNKLAEKIQPELEKKSDPKDLVARALAEKIKEEYNNPNIIICGIK